MRLVMDLAGANASLNENGGDERRLHGCTRYVGMR
jgi:hypothetical protein